MKLQDTSIFNRGPALPVRILNVLLATVLIALPMSLAPSLSWAGDGHDHDAPSAGATSQASPRIVASSELFELVGVLNAKKLVLYLDEKVSNTPVKNATIIVEIAGKKLTAKSDDNGDYFVELEQIPPEGVLAVTASVSAKLSSGALENDLLAGELDVHAAGAEGGAASKGVAGTMRAALHEHSWKEFVPWVGLGVLAFALVAGLWRFIERRRQATRQRSTSMLNVPLLLALALASVSTMFPGKVLAGPEHNHDGPAQQAATNSPKRMPDGTVFVPKPAQRQMSTRTALVTDAQHTRSVELTGKVVIDPNAGGRVQSALAGRIETTGKGLPSVGQRVSKGEVLAYVVPTSGAIERSNQLAQIAELQAAKVLAEKRRNRLKDLSDTVPRKEIDAVESEIQSLEGRITAVNAGLQRKDVLQAPISGIITSSGVVAGQVVDARELLFEIVEPTRLRVEALAYDPKLATAISAASLSTIDGKTIPLSFVGAAKTLREQALPLIFSAPSGALASMSVGQPVKVLIKSGQPVKGISIPAAALTKNPSNQSMVWVKTAPELFSPRTVLFEPLDGANILVLSGLKATELVVVEGASLLSQIR
jgi:membrane fusion protein, heavy metal efflux system